MVSLLVTINTFLYECFEKAKKYPYIWICFVILLAAISLIWLPHWRVSYFGINNATENATLENQYRATIAQILGGVAIGIGIYYTWRRVTIAENSLKHSQETFVANQQIAQENLKVAQDGQITERFTRAVDQLGNDKIEVRLGGIYALERISNESKKDYWPIMEILTAYVRKNSSVEVVENKKVMHLAMQIQSNESTIREVPEERKISLDIQAVLTVLGERKYSFNNGEYKCLNLRKAHLEGANLWRANLWRANLEGANLSEAHLERADLSGAHLEGASLMRAHLEGSDLREAHFEGANLSEANLEESSLKRAHLEGASLRWAHLEGATRLTIDQLSKVKTLYEAKLDDKLLIPLKEKFPALFEKPNTSGCLITKFESAIRIK